MKPDTTQRKRIRAAIYCRRSTDEEIGSLGSTEVQRESCEAYIASQRAAGWELVTEHFTDIGFSGSNVERPAFQRLLAAIEAGDVDAVVVHRVDRLSRSLSDFAKLLDVFECKQIAFVSVTQSFSTASSSGKLVLHILMSFAEFERALISERTSLKMRASLKRGQWIGGRPVYGYRVVDRRLVIDESESVVVRRIFDSYSRTRSVFAVARELNAAGIKPRPGRDKLTGALIVRDWDKQLVLAVLKSAQVAGLVPCQNELFPGAHEAIVTREQFDAVQELLKQKPNRRPPQPSTSTALLAGLLRCAACGSTMSPHFATKKNRRFASYVCRKYAQQGAAACPGARVSAHTIESAVVEQIKSVGRDARVLKATAAALQQPVDNAELKAQLAEFVPIWNALLPAERKRALHLLVESVAFDGAAGSLEIRFRESPIRTLAPAPTEKRERA